jgi:hypothetical protein
METLDSNLTRENNFFSTNEITSYLLETAKWGKFLAITGYIGIGLVLLAAIGVMGMGMGGASQLVPGMGIGMGAFGMIYIIIAVFYFFPVYYLHQFSLKMKQGLMSQDPQNIAIGFRNLKSLFKFMGIFTVVILSIYAVIFVAALVIGAIGAL